jgi:predicted RNase H-like HicB family nuclease
VGEVEREEDGRWVAAFRELPGVIAYGATRDEAKRRAWALALAVVAEKVEHGEPLGRHRRASRPHAPAAPSGLTMAFASARHG